MRKHHLKRKFQQSGFDGTTDSPGIGHGNLLAVKHGVYCILHEGFRNFISICIIIINGTNIPDHIAFRLVFQQEYMRSSLGTVLRENLLPFIQEVGKGEVLFFCTLLHFLKTVSRLHFGVVRINGNNRNP